VLTLWEMTQKVLRGLGVIIRSPQCSFSMGVVRIVWMGSLLGCTAVLISIDIGISWISGGAGFSWFQVGRIHALSVLNRVGGFGCVGCGLYGFRQSCGFGIALCLSWFRMVFESLLLIKLCSECVYRELLELSHGRDRSELALSLIHW